MLSAPVRLRQRPELAWRQEPELFAEVGLHFLDPLRHKSFRRNHQDPFDQPTELQFPEDQPRLDGLAQAHFIGQQVANLVVAHRTGQGVELVRQRDDASFQRSQQNILRQGVGNPSGTHSVCDAVEVEEPSAFESAPAIRLALSQRSPVGESKPRRRCGSRPTPR